MDNVPTSHKLDQVAAFCPFCVRLAARWQDFDPKQILEAEMLSSFQPKYLADVNILRRASYNRSGHISLKVPNIEFDFDVCVDSMQFQTHTMKT